MGRARADSRVRRIHPGSEGPAASATQGRSHGRRARPSRHRSRRGSGSGIPLPQMEAPIYRRLSPRILHGHGPPRPVVRPSRHGSLLPVLHVVHVCELHTKAQVRRDSKVQVCRRLRRRWFFHHVFSRPNQIGYFAVLESWATKCDKLPVGEGWVFGFRKDRMRAWPHTDLKIAYELLITPCGHTKAVMNVSPVADGSGAFFL